MIYEFVDTTELSSSTLLSVEAVKMNGDFLETLIAGYRTLSVTGREGLSPEIERQSVGSRDGSFVTQKRYPERIITVKYQLMAKTNEAFREAYNELNRLLDTEDAEFIFMDEEDKFFIGTPSEIGEVESGRNRVIGEWKILCTYPFKQSVEEFEVETQIIEDQQMFVIPYDGTMPSHPVITADVATDLGYLAYIDQIENIIQLGDPDEVEGEDYKQNETLINSTFSTMPAVWTSTTTAKLPSGKQEGSTKIATVNGKSALTANSYGSTTNTLHGCAVAAAIPADSEGNAGGVNCKFEFKYIYQSSKAAQSGRLTFTLGNTSKYLAAIMLHKGKGSSTGYAYLYVNGVQKNKMSFAVGKKNAFTQGTASITKYGGKITFTIGGKSYSYTDAAIAETLATHAYMYFGRNVYKKTRTTYANCAVMGYIGVYSAKVIKNYVEKWRDIPNKFTAGDKVVVDCSNASIMVNDNAMDGLGALGNDWEQFALRQGMNYIACTYSEWTVTPPTFELKYRKVYL